MLRKRFLLLFIVVSVGIGLLWIEDYTTQSTQEDNEGVSLLPDYYGEGLKNRTFSDHGALKHQFNAQRSVHFPVQRLTELTQPQIKTIADDGEVWIIQSLSGIHFEDDKKLVLKQDVQILPATYSELSNNKDAAIIRTSKLTLFIESKIAKTDQPVEVISLNGRIDAVGMIITMDQQRVEFLSQVKAKYVP
ncbi:MAG: LPS export ABC transporter protein LptC [Oleispira sp.]|jgi:LPS export ABC transporter protein LptC